MNFVAVTTLPPAVEAIDSDRVAEAHAERPVAVRESGSTREHLQRVVELRSRDLAAAVAEQQKEQPVKTGVERRCGRDVLTDLLLLLLYL